MSHEWEVKEEVDTKEYRVPGALLGIGVLIYFVYAFWVGGMGGVAAMAIGLPVRLFFQIVLGVMACLFTARVVGANFGYVGSAILKLSAVFVFPGAVTFFIPWVGWLIAMCLYWGLLEWLFELEAMETIVLVVVMFLVNAGAIFFVALMGFGMHL